MATSIPSVWILNFKGVQWLQDESKRWGGIVPTLSGPDYQAGKDYLAAVNAELAQRTTQYQTVGGTIGGGVSALFEALGGSGGAGASGLSTAVVSGVGDAGSAVLSGANKILYILAGLALILGIAYIVIRKK